MKTRIIIVFLLVGLQSCMDEFVETYLANSPIYMSYDELRTSIKKTDPADIVHTGKIYFKDDFIFINEELKGVHVINNSDKQNPQNIAFIEIPGNVDIAIKGNILYADSYVDLVAIDISDLDNITEVGRKEDVFPYTLPPYDEEYRVADVDEDNGVVIDWEIKKVKSEVENNYYPVYYGGLQYYEERLFALDGASSANSMGGSYSSGSTFGVGGSMARFGLYDEYLYVVDERKLYMFDVSTPSEPVNAGSTNVGWDVETLFIYDSHIFFGTTTGMRIYSIKIPNYPEYVGQFSHVTSCDPVVVDNGYAYITLRGGNNCGTTVSRLDVLQLSDDYINNQLVASAILTEPYGLGIDGSILFVCDGTEGLKIYDVSDVQHFSNNLISVFPGINTYDVIPFDNVLFMIGGDGFYQYDYTDINNISLLSHIPVVEP